MFFKKVLGETTGKNASRGKIRAGSLLLILALMVVGVVGVLRVEKAAHADNSTVTIDKTIQYQQMEGFGSFGTDSSDANNTVRFQTLGADVVRVGVDPSFEPSDGDYNLNTNPNDQCKGQSAPIDAFNQMKAMKAKSDALGISVKFIATVWSPPGWMKQNNCILGNNSGTNRIINTPANLAKFADFLVHWVQAVKDNTGIDMYAISLQNEPTLALTYASTYYTPEDFRDTLKAVGPVLRQNFPNLKIFFPEEVAQISNIDAYVEAVEADSTARQYLDALAVHGYGSNGINPAGGRDFWTQVAQEAGRYSLPVWMTETSGYDSSWGDAIKLGGDIYQAIYYGNASMWVWWTTACPGNYNESEALLNCDYTFTPKAAVSEQYYKYVRPGAVRVDAKSSDSDVLVTAFTNRNDNSTSIVLINQNTSNSKDVTFSFNGSNYPSSYNVIRSSSSENAVNVGTYTSGSTLTLPASSVVTLTGTSSQQDPTTGPSIVTQPQNLTVSPGSQTTLSVQATGTPPLHYQWQRNGVNIDNAVGPLYTFTPTTADNGATYSVTITNAYGSVTSNTVTLTVGSFAGVIIPQATTSITVNGNGSEADWSKAPSYQITHAVNNPSGLSGSFQALWDSKNLYVLVKVTDANLANNKDSVEIYVDGSNGKKTYYDTNTWQFVLGQSDYSLAEYQGGTQTNPPTFPTYGQANGGTGGTFFNLEIGIPWSDLGVTPGVGTLIGLDVDVAQKDSSGNTHKIFWYNTADSDWSTPANFGTAQLTGSNGSGGGTPTPTPNPTATPTPNPTATPTPNPTATPTPNPTATPTPTGGSSFSTGFENSDPQPTWTNTVDNGGQPAGGSANIGGICCGLTGPEAGIRSETAHSGAAALLYSGDATNSSGANYAYMKIFDLSGQNVTVGSSTTLSYWIFPQSGGMTSGNNSTCVALDLIFQDSSGHLSNLRDSGVVDQNGNKAHPDGQCNKLTLNAWNHVTINLGAHSSGLKIVRIDLGYDQPNATGGYRGYVDDISITN